MVGGLVEHHQPGVADGAQGEQHLAGLAGAGQPAFEHPLRSGAQASHDGPHAPALLTGQGGHLVDGQHRRLLPERHRDLQALALAVGEALPAEKLIVGDAQVSSAPSFPAREVSSQRKC